MSRTEEYNDHQPEPLDQEAAATAKADSTTTGAKTVDESSETPAEAKPEVDAEADKPTPGKSASDDVADDNNTKVGALTGPIDIHKAKPLPRTGFPNPH